MMRRALMLAVLAGLMGCGGNDGGPKDEPVFRVLHSIHTEDSVAYITENLYGLVDADSAAIPGVAVKFFYPTGWRVVEGYDSTSTPYGKISMKWKVAKNDTPGTYVMRACAYLTPSDSVCDAPPHVTVIVP